MNASPHSTEDLDWVIVGGGLHGVHLAVRLIGEAKADPQRIRIVDPAPRLLHEWNRCSSNTGMEFLRSPAVHHLDLEPFSLLRFAHENADKKHTELFAPPYNRPSVALFNAHCSDVISRYKLDELHVQGAVTDISLSCESVTLQLQSQRTLSTQRVLLAMGASRHPRWPIWAGKLLAAGVKIHHIFEAGFELEPKDWPDRVAIIGGGLTAAQAALRLANGTRQVHLIARHDIREHQFDSDPGWVGPKHMRKYTATKSPTTRRKMIQSARHVGSMPADIHRELRRRIQDGSIHWHKGEPTATAVDSGAVFQIDNTYVPVEGVLLATGFETKRPGGDLIDRMIARHQLPCASCGFPLTDNNLRWHPRIFVSGPLAELEIGPVSRNIAGARRAAERIIPVALRATKE